MENSARRFAGKNGIDNNIGLIDQNLEFVTRGANANVHIAAGSDEQPSRDGSTGETISHWLRYRRQNRRRHRATNRIQTSFGKLTRLSWPSHRVR